jgi:hypothetical protein
MKSSLFRPRVIGAVRAWIIPLVAGLLAPLSALAAWTPVGAARTEKRRMSVMGENFLRGLRRLVAVGLGAYALLGPGLALAQSEVIFGPVSVKLPTSSLISFSKSFSVPASVTGPYLLRVQLSAPNSLTTLSFKLNDVQVLSLSDFAGGVTLVERTAVLQTSNTVSLQLAGKEGTVITITVFATPNLPKPISLAPDPLSVTVGASGTLTATLSPAPTAAGTLIDPLGLALGVR